jgi:hypothetical protein
MTNHRTTWTPDHEQSRLDHLEQYGHDYNDIHGLHKWFVVVCVVYLIAMLAVFGFAVWAVVERVIELFGVINGTA